MKTYNPGGFNIRLTQCSALILAVALFFGCQSTGYVKSDAAARRLKATAEEVRTEGRCVDATLAALNDLIKTPSGDLGVQFQLFNQALNQLLTSEKRASDLAAGLKGKSSAYFETWDRELKVMSDPQIRQASAARRDEVSRQYETVTRRYHETQGALTPVISYLLDIRAALSTDLTTPGLQAASQPAANAKDKAGKVQTGLTQSSADLDALAVKMSSYITTNAN